MLNLIILVMMNTLLGKMVISVIMSMNFLSYITSRCGEVKSVSEVSPLLDELLIRCIGLNIKKKLKFDIKLLKKPK